MMRLGAAIFGAVQAGGDPGKALSHHAGILRNLITQFSLQAGLNYEAAFVDQQAQQLANLSAAWASCAFPLVVPTHSLAASLMASHVPPDAIADVVAPWPTFAVVVPAGLLRSADLDGSLYSIQHAGLWTGRRAGENVYRLWMQPEGNGHVVVHDFPSVSALADATSGSGVFEQGDFVHRAVALVGRLVLGTCIELDQPKHRIEIGEGRPQSKRAKRGEPKAWTFQLKREVRVDCREWVVQFLRGGQGVARSLQSLVRGHHKRQPCGPAGKDRKWIHIEPYWRGPDEGPIAVREHRLGGGPNADSV